MFLPAQCPPLPKMASSVKFFNKKPIVLSANSTETAGDSIRCQICCANSIGKTERCKSEDNPNCICLQIS
jgi:hypothetical protein